MKATITTLILLLSCATHGHAFEAPASLADLSQAAGTIHCDGARRGSAVIVDPGGEGTGLPGVVLATAAHVFYDLERQMRYSSCRFHFRGLDQLPDNGDEIDFDWVFSGNFDPADDASNPATGSGDWAFVFLQADWSDSRAARALPLASPGDLAQVVAQVERRAFHVVAWNQQRRKIDVTPACAAIRSAAGDIGGGEWLGQWLDGCEDDGPGASGGALVVATPDGPRMVAIRTGEHWDPFSFPEGPPTGEPWNPGTNSRAARGIEGAALAGLRRLVRQAEKRAILLPGSTYH